MTHNHECPRDSRPNQLKHAEVASQEPAIQELCKTDLPVSSICRYLERDGVLLGRDGKQQARPLMRLWLPSLCPGIVIHC